MSTHGASAIVFVLCSLLLGACEAPVAFFAVETKPGLAALTAIETALEVIDPLPTQQQVEQASMALGRFEANADWPRAPKDVRDAAGILVAAIERHRGLQDACTSDCYQPTAAEVEAAIATAGAWRRAPTRSPS